MYSVQLKNTKDIYDFCMLNGITDINKFVQDCFKQGFDIERFGLLGKMGGEQEKRVEIPVEVIKEVVKVEYVEVPVEKIVTVEKPVEKLVEVIKEVPVEVIKEVQVEKIVEVIKEVPVEKVVINEVIKEVPVEKIVTIYDNSSENELLLKIQQLEEEISTKTTEIGTIRKEFSTKTEEMEIFFQNEMSKKDEELDELRRNLDILVTNDKTKMLQETLQNLRSELQQKNEQLKELEKINRELLNGPNQGYLLRGSNLNRRI